MSDQDLAARVRAALAGAGTVREVKMFGGIGFMLNGNMTAGASSRGLLLRVGPEHYAQALARPGVSAMVMRGRAVAGYVRVDPAGLDEAALRDWVRLAAAFVQTLPAKAGRATSSGNEARRSKRAKSAEASRSGSGRPRSGRANKGRG